MPASGRQSHQPHHLDAIATGSVIASATVWVSCQQARGDVYTGPVSAGEG